MMCRVCVCVCARSACVFVCARVRRGHHRASSRVRHRRRRASRLILGAELTRGCAWGVSCAQAEEMGADIIVLGADGLTAFRSGRRATMGSTSDRVVRNGRTNVVLVQPPRA